MTTIGALLEHPDAQALAWALLHFLWQGAAIGVLVWCVWRFARLSAAARYGVGVAALALMLAAPLATFLLLRQEAPVSPVSFATTEPHAAEAVLAVLPAAREIAAAPPPAAADPFEPFVLAIWLAGVIVLSVRLIGGWIVVHRVVRRGVQPITGELAQVAADMRARLGVRRAVRMLESTAVAVPVTIGWIKPVVLLPLSALSGLSNSQVEALIAHELAHVRRHDYLVNLLQSAIETVLFYHPAVWWLSKRVRAEREHCCDDLAVTLCDRVVYVNALTDLAALTTPRLALAATDGSLIRRVKRLLGPGREGDATSGWLSVMLVVLVIGGAVPVAIAAMTARPVVDAGDDAAAGDQRQGDPRREVRPEGERPRADRREIEPSFEVAPEPLALDAERQSRDVQAVLAREADVERQMRERQVELQHEQLRIELEKSRAEMEAERTLLITQFEDARRRLDLTRQRVEVGTATTESLMDVQGTVRTLEAKLQALETTQRLRERELELKQQQLVQLRDFVERRAELDRERAAAAAVREDRLTTLRREYDRLADDYTRATELTQRGLMAPSQAQELQRRLRELEQTIDEIRRELARLRSSEGQSRDLEVAATEPSRRRYDYDLRVTAPDLPPSRYDLQVTTPDRPLSAAQQRDLAALLELSTASTPLGAQDPAAAGHLVALEIQNEPEISRLYVVGGDGTIRLPLLGSIKVAGLTSRQIEDTVRRQLNERRLAPGATVGVSIRRRN